MMRLTWEPRDQAPAPEQRMARLFPAYVWPGAHDVDGDSREIPAMVTWRQVTPEFRQFWLFGIETLHAIHWYFRHLRWHTTADANNPQSTAGVTWAEIVLDFRLATGCRIWKEGQNPTALGQQALAFKMATQSLANVIAKVTQQPVTNLFAGSIIRDACVLRSMGFGKALGLTIRPQLMQPFKVGHILASWIVQQHLPTDSANRPIGSYSWVPEIPAENRLWHPDANYAAPAPCRKRDGVLVPWHPRMDVNTGRAPARPQANC